MKSSQRSATQTVFLVLGLLCGLGALVVSGAFVMLKLNEEKLNQVQSLDTEFTVPAGAGRNAIFKKLEEEGVIECALCLEIHKRVFGLDGQIKAGTFALKGDFSTFEVVNTLVEGQVIQFYVTLVEGKTLDEWLTRLWQHPEITKTLSGDTRDERYKAVQKALNLKRYPEGLFLPETYAFGVDTSEIAILKRALKMQQDFISKHWGDRQTALPIESEYEALILASIVEKETGDPSERPIIAGVFVNRLDKKMRLETDPTVIYGIKEYDGNITRAHLREYTPYNTYRIPRLPPTPIAAPSRAAILAVLHPQKTDAIFFVARGDGTHVFSQTLKQHNAAVRAYQLQRRKDYRSAPKKVSVPKEQ